MKNDFFRLNTEDLKTKVSNIDLNIGEIELSYDLNNKISLKDVTSVWFRRTGLVNNNISNFSTQIEETIIPGNSKYISSILKSELAIMHEYIIDTLYTCIPNKIGNPKVSGLNKLITLKLAKAHGLLVPESFIISSSKELEEVIKHSGEEYISKAFAEGVYLFTKENGYYTYTEKVVKEDVPDNFFPSLLQKCIQKLYEIRAFYLNGKFYSMAIFSQQNEETAVDFRKSNKFKNRYVPYLLSSDIESKLISLFKDLNLNSGSVDFIVNKSNDLIFLEVNPVGQYAMTSQPCNYNLDKLIAETLSI